jgi:UDP-glucuronate decarboxylase
MEGPERQPVRALSSVLQRYLRGDEFFAVTGATGWLGRCALDVLDETLGAPQALTKVAAFASRPTTLVTAAGRRVDVRPLAELRDQVPSPTHILHFAYLTKDRLDDLPLPAFVSNNIAITTALVDALQRHRPRGLVAASSGAVYEDGGDLATDLEHNAYGTLKHLDELVLHSACQGTHTVLVVPRIFSLAGGAITKPDRYALGDLVKSGLAGEALRVDSPSPIIRTYADIRSVVGLALWLMLNERSATFDTGGDELEVGELALAVARALDLPEDSVSRATGTTRGADRYVGDPASWHQLLDEAGIRPRPLVTLIRETARSMATDLAPGSENDLSTTERAL